MNAAEALEASMNSSGAADLQAQADELTNTLGTLANSSIGGYALAFPLT